MSDKPKSPVEEPRLRITKVVNLKEVDGNVVVDDPTKPFSWEANWGPFDPEQDEAEHLERIKRELEK